MPANDKNLMDELDDDDDLGDDSFEGATGGAPSTTEDDEFESFEIPPPLCGIFRGHVSSVKRNPNDGNQLIITITCEAPEFPGAEVTLWAHKKKPAEIHTLAIVCKLLGLKVISPPEGGYLMKPERLLNKSGMFVADTYVNKNSGETVTSLLKGRGPNKKSAEWIAYAKTQNFTNEQLAILAKCQGVIAPEHEAMFR